MAIYTLLWKTADTESLFSSLSLQKPSPFNLNKDLKKIVDASAFQQNMLAALDKDQLYKSYPVIYRASHDSQIYVCKVRVANENNNHGKSNGYRCIFIVDDRNALITLIHLYDHKDKDNLSSKEKSQLKELIEDYATKI